MSESKSMVRVGAGRGFAVQERIGFKRCLVITAAHCLGKMPAPADQREDGEETYPDLLGPLGEATSTWAQSLFVDQIADIAVLAR